MTSKLCRLVGAGIICIEDKKSNTFRMQPKPELYSNIPTLRKILELVIQDWERAAAPFQNNIDNAATENQKIYHVGQALLELPNHYFKCLFSYIMFFVSLEDAYDLFYEELNAINRASVFRVKHRKNPQRNSYIKKVRAVRNISIVHLGSNEVHPIDAKAAMMWEPLMLTKSKDADWNLSKLSFGSGRRSSRDLAGNITEQSMDLEIKSIDELQSECMEYIDLYDEVCANYLKTLADKLPTEESSVFYSFEK